MTVERPQAVALEPGPSVGSGTERPYLEAVDADPAEAPEHGVEATLDGSVDLPDRVIGGVRVFAWGPGRVYPVRTAPLRVTLLTLGPGERVIAKAAGDTVRWQIGETHSGDGPGRRAHVLIKPFERGLETNLVITTTGGLYMVALSSGPDAGFDAAVTWDLPPEARPRTAAVDGGMGTRVDALDGSGPDPLVEPVGPLDAGYSILPRGRAPAWTPTAVLTDGARTFLRFPPALEVGEAPALFVIGPDGARQTVGYRQQGSLWVVDQVLDRAELRLGDRRARVVRIQRLHP
jgi:type IV secretion system protein VirB9